MQTRLVLDKKQGDRAKNLGVSDLKKKFNIDEMVKGDVIFCATAITDGDILDGIKDLGDSYKASTFVLQKSTMINKKVSNIHKKWVHFLFQEKNGY